MPRPRYLVLADRIELLDPEPTHAVVDGRGSEFGHHARKIDADRAARFLNEHGHTFDGPYQVVRLPRTSVA